MTRVLKPPLGEITSSPNFNAAFLYPALERKRRHNNYQVDRPNKATLKLRDRGQHACLLLPILQYSSCCGGDAGCVALDSRRLSQKTRAIACPGSVKAGMFCELLRRVLAIIKQHLGSQDQEPVCRCSLCRPHTPKPKLESCSQTKKKPGCVQTFLTATLDLGGGGIPVRQKPAKAKCCLIMATTSTDATVFPST